nr:hypothetical protein [Tanacetum cinerariifolium]
MFSLAFVLGDDTHASLSNKKPWNVRSNGFHRFQFPSKGKGNFAASMSLRRTRFSTVNALNVVKGGKQEDWGDSTPSSNISKQLYSVEDMLREAVGRIDRANVSDSPLQNPMLSIKYMFIIYLELLLF